MEMKMTEEGIGQLIEQMTLEEKVGQLNQKGPSMVGTFGMSMDEIMQMVEDGRITMQELMAEMAGTKADYYENDLRAGKIGSYAWASVEMCNYLQKIAVEETRLHIPLFFGYDVVHGFRTITPIPLGESCAWDTALWEETASMSAREAAANGVKMTFAPMVDVAKDARWGRIAESAGEDALLNGDYGAARVRGFQNHDLSRPDSMAACVKHFAAYGAVESGRDYSRVDMSEQKFREEYLPSYAKAIGAGAASVMPAFNDINGIPCSVNRKLLRDILRNELHFDGVTVSDSNAIAECVNHGIAADRADAAAKALSAGMDIDMNAGCFADHLVSLVESGRVSEKVLDEAVRRVLRLKMKMGLFENPYFDEEAAAVSLLTTENLAVAKKAAEESMVLLKNEGVLPLKAGTPVILAGDLADMAEQLAGTWSYGSKAEDFSSIRTVLEKETAVKYLSTDAVLTKPLPGFLTGGSHDWSDDAEEQNNPDDSEAQNNPDSASIPLKPEAVIAVIGETKAESGEAASKSDISLSARDMALFRKLKETGLPVIVVLMNGRPMAIPELAKSADAIVEIWAPGIEGGEALAELLFGKINPSGKLTTTFPYASGQCPLYYDHINTGRPAGRFKFTSKYLDAPNEPVFPFGFGLSYTKYTYSGLSAVQSGSNIEADITVTNSGQRDGDEIVQCYVHDPVARRVRPVKRLAGYRRIHLKAGESERVHFSITRDAISYYDAEMHYGTDSGEIEVLIGGSSEDTMKAAVDYRRTDC